MGGLLARAARRRSQAHIRRVAAVAPDRASGPVADVYAQVERDFGMLAPPVSLHSPAPPVLAACWVMLRETLVASGVASRAAKEAVAAAVSHGNACPYCVDVHGATLYGLVRRRDATAVVDDNAAGMVDRHLGRIAVWARTSGQRDSARRATMPVSGEQAAELLGVAVAFQYVNRMVNVFLDPSPIPARVGAGARGRVLRAVGLLMASTVRRQRPPGDALALLPPAPLPDDLGWAAASPTVAEAFARTAAAVDAGGLRAVPDPVRDLVEAELAGWDGQPKGIGRGWVTEAVAGLPTADRPAGRLALLTAMASYQMDDATVDDFRRDRPDDRTLIELTAWASLTAARRVGGWTPKEGS